jgi:hypothetical protein
LFLAELVPDSMRGKEIGGFNPSAGGGFIQIIEYEHVTISEVNVGPPFPCFLQTPPRYGPPVLPANSFFCPDSRDKVITVTFTHQNCQAVARR